MRGLSLTQPWATLVAIGAKKVETRSWSPSYRGQIAIHASKGFPRWARAICGDEPLFRAALFKGGFRGWADLPLGKIVAVVDLVEVKSTGCKGNQYRADWVHELTTQERWFGDYGPERFGLFLSDIKRVSKPIPCKGALGLWAVPEDIAHLVAEQIGKVTGQLAAMEASNGG